MTAIDIRNIVIGIAALVYIGIGLRIAYLIYSREWKEINGFLPRLVVFAGLFFLTTGWLLFAFAALCQNASTVYGIRGRY